MEKRAKPADLYSKGKSTQQIRELHKQEKT